AAGFRSGSEHARGRKGQRRAARGRRNRTDNLTPAATGATLRTGPARMISTIAMHRRSILRGGIAAAAWGLVHASCGSTPAGEPRTAGTATPPPPTPKRILILGGTGFIGPKTVAAAVARGHEVTIFNRGKREKI